jgi:hypothetical protein
LVDWPIFLLANPLPPYCHKTHRGLLEMLQNGLRRYFDQITFYVAHQAVAPLRGYMFQDAGVDLWRRREEPALRLVLSQGIRSQLSDPFEKPSVSFALDPVLFRYTSSPTRYPFGRERASLVSKSLSKLLMNFGESVFL